ncbi:unnamed protein product [Ambrosiozyma monospora]|uniref:Unnamed protein product n=1 Tax=Ambrosiozyma monospora TaxID=43982 RepID=A0ACB5T8X4_AMBMO|nr:unnamed protein product [Ambrosiozyma monospora]
MPTSETARSWMADAFNQLVKNLNTPNNKQLVKILNKTQEQLHQQKQKESHSLDYEDEKVLTSSIPKEQQEEIQVQEIWFQA